MKTVILAGGLGTRLSERTGEIPKPMVEIGGRPILWHIMRHYASQGFSDFCVALGYRGEVVKRYFLDYHAVSGDLAIDLGTGEVETVGGIGGGRDDWKVHLADTGQGTNTGGRLLALRDQLCGRGIFMVTYGDGLSDVDYGALIDFHKAQGKLATVTAVRPPARFGGLVFDAEDANRVARFTEKPQIGEGWIHGGFMVLEPAVLDRIDGPETSLESEVLDQLARDGELAAYRHESFWQCMDTLRDVRVLEELWRAGAPWVG